VLSYFAVGPVFATQTKPGYRAVGLELVTHVAGMQPAIPFFCIGGINRGNVHQVAATGARRVVAVSDILCDRDPAAAVREIRMQLVS
jgi:thiamine-phosphate pyrophosphorylase